MPSTIVHFEIPANDVEKLSKFYTECFGWKFDKASMPGMDYWLISTGEQGQSVGGGMYKKEDPNARPLNYLAVDSVESAVEKIKQAGGLIFVEKQEVPQMGWMAVGADPEGNPLAVWQAMEGAMERRQEMTATARQ